MLSNSIPTILAQIAIKMSHVLQFDLSGLSAIYGEAIKRREPTLIFELRYDIGCLVFIMFFDEEDKNSRDELFIYLARTNKMISVKMYGNHSKGVFLIYVKADHEQDIRHELGIVPGKMTPFVLQNFLEQLNKRIPQTLPLEVKISTFQKHRTAFANHPAIKRHVDEALKIHLVGLRRLSSPTRPRGKDS